MQEKMVFAYSIIQKITQEYDIFRKDDCKNRCEVKLKDLCDSILHAHASIEEQIQVLTHFDNIYQNAQESIKQLYFCPKETGKRQTKQKRIIEVSNNEDTTTQDNINTTTTSQNTTQDTTTSQNITQDTTTSQNTTQDNINTTTTSQNTTQDTTTSQNITQDTTTSQNTTQDTITSQNTTQDNMTTSDNFISNLVKIASIKIASETKKRQRPAKGEDNDENKKPCKQTKQKKTNPVITNTREKTGGDSRRSFSSFPERSEGQTPSNEISPDYVSENTQESTIDESDKPKSGKNKKDSGKPTKVKKEKPENDKTNKEKTKKEKQTTEETKHAETREKTEPAKHERDHEHDHDDDDDENDNVSIVTVEVVINGKLYLKDDEDNIYDRETTQTIGKYNTQTHSIDLL
jgi:hypothetical protein